MHFIDNVSKRYSK